MNITPESPGFRQLLIIMPREATLSRQARYAINQCGGNYNKLTGNTTKDREIRVPAIETEVIDLLLPDSIRVQLLSPVGVLKQLRDIMPSDSFTSFETREMVRSGVAGRFAKSEDAQIVSSMKELVAAVNKRTQTNLYRIEKLEKAREARAEVEKENRQERLKYWAARLLLGEDEVWDEMFEHFATLESLGDDLTRKEK